MKRFASRAGNASGIAVAKPVRRNKTIMVLAMLPLFMLTGTSMTALANRLGQESMDNNVEEGWIAKNEASNIASETCTLITGEKVQILDTHRTWAYLKSAKQEMHEWEVLCRAETTDYILRMDAETGHVFGVNQITSSSTENSAPQATHLTREEAIAYAKRYVQLLRGTTKDLQVINVSRSVDLGLGTSQNVNFRESRPGRNESTVSVSINLESGDLMTLWYSPVLAKK